MKLTVLGSGTSSPSLARGSAGYLLQAGQENWLFDTGLGTLHRLLEAGVGWDRIDRIFFTHAHVDHHLEIIHLLFQNNNFQSPRTRDLYLYGSEAFFDFFGKVQDLYGKWIRPSAYGLICHAMNRDEIQIGQFRVRAGAVDHIPSSLAYRVESPEGRVLVYSGDTDYCASLIDLARGADLLLIEASTPNAEKIPGHLTPRLAGEVGEKAEVRRIMLTHFYPCGEQIDRVAECRGSYSGEILLAEDLFQIEI